MTEVTSVNGQTGAVVLTAVDVEAVSESEAGQPDGIATLDHDGELTASQLPLSVESSSALATEPTVYVSKNGLDTNSGLGPGQAFLTVHKAIEHLKALPGKTGHIRVGPGLYIEPPLKLPPGSTIIGAGYVLTEIRMEAGANGNVLQSEAWGTPTALDLGGFIDRLTLNGNASEQTATIAPESIVTAVTAISEASETLPVVSTTGFAASGKLWVGESLCTYTGKTSTSFTGVTTTYGSFSATVEMLVVPYGGVGHGLAIQGARIVVGADTVAMNCVGSGIVTQGASPTLAGYEILIQGKRSELNGRYDMEILPHAADGQVSAFVGFASGLGSIFVGAGDWSWGELHPTGNLVYGKGQLAKQLIRICASYQRFSKVILDSAPYDAVRIDALSYNQPITDITIHGETYKSSSASGGAGLGISGYGNGASKVERLNINMGVADRVYTAFSPYPRTQLVGVQNLEAPPGGKVQVLSALGFSPLGSAAGGTISVSGSGTLAYTGSTSVGTYLTEAAEIGATTLKLFSTAGLAASGIVTAYPAPSGGATTAKRIAYTGISGNELTGVSGVTEALPLRTGAAQHFLTGVTGGTGTAVADATQMIQSAEMVGKARQIVTSGFAHFRVEKNVQSPTTASPKLRVTWVESGTTPSYNPFLGTIKIAVGATEGSVAHNLHGTPNFYEGTPTTDPQQRWWLTVTSTTVVAHLSAAAATSEVTFNVVARSTAV